MQWFFSLISYFTSYKLIYDVFSHLSWRSVTFKGTKVGPWEVIVQTVSCDIVSQERRPGNSPASTTYLLAAGRSISAFFSRLYKQFCIFPLPGTNWVGQILSDLVATFEKKTQDEESVNDEDLEEFPYLEVGDAGKFEVGTEYLLKL